MATKPALMNLPIETSDAGFYSGFSKDVTISAKILVSALIIWAVVFPENASNVLSALNSFLLSNFASWYIFRRLLCCGLFVICLGSKLGQALAWKAWRNARIFEFLLVFDDVRRRDRDRNAHLCNRRANLSLW